MIVVVAAETAELVDSGERFLDGAEGDVPEPDVVDRTDRAAFRAGAVVGEHEDERVLEVAGLVEEVEQSADVLWHSPGTQTPPAQMVDVP